MDFDSYEVRKKADNEEGFKLGLLGKVIGVNETLSSDNQSRIIVVQVAWTGVDEETGELTQCSMASPSTHMPTELITHVEPQHWLVEDLPDNSEASDELPEEPALN